MNQIPYDIVETLPLKAPRGKLPYIEDNGQKIADSRLIVTYLKTTYGDHDNTILSPAEQAIATSFQRLLEENLYWIGMVTRWNYSEENWQENKQAIFGALPPIARDLAASVYRKKIRGQIMGHGMGRLTLEEMFELGKEDIDSLANFLDKKSYFMGAQPTSLDASAYGILINTLGCPIESPLKDYALTKSNIFDYCRRMQARFFPELPWCAS